MDAEEMKVVVIDDDLDRRNIILSVLPDYMRSIVATYGESAKKVIDGREGPMADLVIMNADDPKGRGLYMFNWLKNNKSVSDIPIVLLTEDEFSESSIDFLQIGDADFYEGDVEDYEFYAFLMELLDRKDFVIEEEEPSYEEEKTIDRVAGLSLKAGGKRSMVIRGDERISNLKTAIKNSNIKAEQVLDLLYDAILKKEESGEHVEWYPKKMDRIKELRGGHSAQEADETASNMLDEQTRMKAEAVIRFRKIRQRAQEEKEEEERRLKEKRKEVKEHFRTSREAAKGSLDEQAESLKDGLFAKIDPEKVRALLKDNAGEKENAAGGLYIPESPISRKIVIVDDDDLTARACRIFMGEDNDYKTFETDLEALEYFEKEDADLLIIDYTDPRTDGIRMLRNIRAKTFGEYVPVIFILNSLTERMKSILLKIDGVHAVINKPIKKKELLFETGRIFKQIDDLLGDLK